ncbi:hypothetical protein P389DRAFT_196430 [Cystobasidium minutum MCA 4210]|uniref:uncharacterized protein n=1 Tax=Cystobasidium minutum MCA 4210 TaxID=1397322 RepID=UPI0034CE3C2F|eukprot:jgi/Rhomi1/196430/gm1.4644_g
MQGMVDEAKAFLESAEGQDFEKDMQESFLAGSPSTQSKWAERILAEKGKRQDLGNAGQSQDSTSGMNKAPSGPRTSGTDSTDTSAYNEAGRDNAQNDGPYTETDTTSSGGYGTNAAGSSFSAANQSGMGGNQPGQFK